MTVRVGILALALLGCGPKDDADGDGVATVDDCDDADPTVGLPVAVFVDEDGDGFGVASAGTSCAPGDGEVTEDGDCDDAEADVNPGVSEECNLRDDDCDGEVDEGFDTSGWFVDGDGDGFGDPEQPETSCDGEGLVSDATDCDDAVATTHPGADEWCNDVDDDCDGDIDEDALDARTWYADGDGDRYGVGDPVVSCDLPPFHTDADGDCDDGDADVNPGEEEICGNGVDDDCDGTAEGCRLEGEITLADAHAKLVSSTAAAGLGGSLSGSADVDGDGIHDVVVGAYEGVGSAYVVSGDQSGDVVVETDALQLDGFEYAGFAGWSVALVPDMNGDGAAEVAVSAPRAGGNGTYNDDGEIYLFFGPVTASASVLDADVLLTGEYFGGAGEVVAGGGDLDGDGAGDLLISAPYTSNDLGGQGRVYLISGDPGGDMDLEDASTIIEGPFVGFGLAGGADFDGDGAEDVLIGTGGGEVALMHGPLASGRLDVADAEAVFEEETAGDGLGGALASGDFDGDGYDDVVIGAPLESSIDRMTGAAYVVFGPHSGRVNLSAADAKMTGQMLGERAGECVASAGDFDGDGADDLLVGAVMFDRTYLVYGPPTGSFSTADADATFLAETGGDRAGQVLGTAGDWNADGYADLLIAAPQHSGVAPGAGAVYVFLGEGL